MPERWLPNPTPEFANDDKAAFKPFALGTRDCIGKNLAYAELKLVLAKVMWHFDIVLDAERTGDWFDQETWGLRFKNPLWVGVEDVKR